MVMPTPPKGPSFTLSAWMGQGLLRYGITYGKSHSSPRPRTERWQVSSGRVSHPDLALERDHGRPAHPELRHLPRRDFDVHRDPAGPTDEVALFPHEALRLRLDHAVAQHVRRHPAARSTGDRILVDPVRRRERPPVPRALLLESARGESEDPAP